MHARADPHATARVFPILPPVAAMRSVLALFCLLALAACQADAPDAPAPEAPAEPAAQAATSPEPGSAAPPFALVSTSGDTLHLADYAGRTVVLEWLNYDCPFVGKHYGGQAMQRLQTESADEGVVWLSVVSSAPGEQGYFEPAAMDARTAREGGKQTAVLLDPKGTVGRAYGARTTPHMFVIDGDGAVVYNGAIDDQPSTDRATLDGARNYVADALAAVREERAPETTRTQPYGCSVKYGDA